MNEDDSELRQFTDEDRKRFTRGIVYGAMISIPLWIAGLVVACAIVSMIER